MCMFYFLFVVFFYLAVAGMIYQVIPCDKKGYSQTEERAIKSVLWPLFLPFYIGGAIMKKIVLKFENKKL